MAINMAGYLCGRYPKQFTLNDDQRTLILQTIVFCSWLAAGAAVFSSIEGWSYADALYFAEVVSIAGCKLDSFSALH